MFKKEILWFVSNIEFKIFFFLNQNPDTMCVEIKQDGCHGDWLFSEVTNAFATLLMWCDLF